MALRRGGVLEAASREAGVSVRGIGRVMGEFDLVQGWLYAGSAAASILASGRTPVVGNMRHVLSDQRESATTRASLSLMRNVLHARACVVNSSAAMHSNRGLRTREWVKISNGVDTGRFRRDAEGGHSLRVELGISDDILLLLQVARAHPHKGHELLLEAVERLRGSRPDLMLALIGEGTTEFTRPGVVGLGARDDVQRCLNAADIVVNPSLTESAPNAVLEAMSCARPCVVTNVGESADLVADTGWVCEVSVEGLIEGLASALAADDEQRDRLGNASRERVMERYAQIACVDAYEALYRRLMRECG